MAYSRFRADHGEKLTQASTVAYKLAEFAKEEEAAKAIVELPHKYVLRTDSMTSDFLRSITLFQDAIILVEGELLNLGPERCKQIVDLIVDGSEAARVAASFKSSMNDIMDTHAQAVRKYADVVTRKSQLIQTIFDGQKAAVEGLVKQVAQYESLYEWIRSRTIATMRERARWLDTVEPGLPQDIIRESRSFVEACGLIQKKIESVVPQGVVAPCELTETASTVAQRFVSRVESREVVAEHDRHIRAREEILLLRELLGVDESLLNDDIITRTLAKLRRTGRTQKQIAKENQAKDVFLRFINVRMIPEIRELKSDIRKAGEKLKLDSRTSRREFQDVINKVKDLHTALSNVQNQTSAEVSASKSSTPSSPEDKGEKEKPLSLVNEGNDSAAVHPSSSLRRASRRSSKAILVPKAIERAPAVEFVIPQCKDQSPEEEWVSPIPKNVRQDSMFGRLFPEGPVHEEIIENGEVSTALSEDAARKASLLEQVPTRPI